MVIFSKDADADRAIMAQILPGNAIDAGGGWMIYALPEAELAVHPEHGPIRHELHMMCEDIEDTRDKLIALGLVCDPVEDLGYGLVSSFALPGGAKIGFYQPRHGRP